MAPNQVAHPAGDAIQVRLLGGLEIRRGADRLPPLDSARAESLLAYLMLHRHAPQQRQRVAFTLWPDSTEAQALTNLRHVLHNLRRELPEADQLIDTTARTLHWRPVVPVWLDVAAFEEAIAAEQPAKAVEIYTGDLLAGRYDEWLLDERERLAGLHADALERLIHQLAQEHRWLDAIQCAERLVRADPLREAAHRLLIRALAGAGNRARALRAYHVCASTLRRELGVEPAQETREAYEALLSATGRAAVSGRAAVHRQSATGKPLLVGRTPQLEQLTTAWRVAAAGRAQLVLVTGEPGIGKTRLIEELRSRCGRSGALTAEARAYPAEGPMAYGGVAAWLRSDAIASRLRRLPAAELTELARLLPELRNEVPDLPEPAPLPEDEQRTRLFSAVTRAILAGATPVLLVADDLHWCDIETLRFVHYLVRAAPDASVLVAGTARLEEIEPRHPAHRLLAALETLERSQEIKLERLSRSETDVLADHVAGRSLTSAEAEQLYAESEGNPLFVIEALRAGAEALTASGTASSSRVRAVIKARLTQLSEPAAALAGAAATIGREFTTRVLADVVGSDEQALVRGLDELWRRGLVRAHGPSAYDFSHGKIREVAYDMLGPARRRDLHLRAAHALVRGFPDDLAVSGQVAAHFEKAGAVADAIAWYERAARAAQQLHASADAVRALEQAIALASDLPMTERATTELRLLTALPAPLVAVEGYLSPRVADVHERALERARKLGAEPEPPLVRSLALARLSRGEFEAARPFGDQLRVRAERDRDDVLWVESAYVLGVAAFWQGRLEAARAEFQAALDRCRPEHRAMHLQHYGQDPEVFCGLRLGYVLWLLGRDDESAQARNQALAVAEREGHPYTRTSTTAWAALLALDQRDEQELRRLVTALAAGAGRPHPQQVARFLEALAAYVDVLDGRDWEGIRRIRQALADARAGEPAAPGMLAMHARILLEACAQGRDAVTGLAAADEALRMGGGMRLWEAETWRLRAEFVAALGEPPSAVEADLARALEVAQRQGARAIERRVRENLKRLERRPAGTR